MVTGIFIFIGLVGVGLILTFVFFPVKDSNSQEERDRRTQESGADMNPLAAWMVARFAWANTKKDAALADRIDAAHALQDAPKNAEAAQHLQDMQHELAEAQTNNIIALTNTATEQGRSTVAQEQFTVAVDAAVVRVKEKEGMLKAERDDEHIRTLNTIQEAATQNQSELNQIGDITDRVLVNIEREAGVEKKELPEHLKKMARGVIRKERKFLLGVSDADQDRLLQARNGADKKGATANAPNAAGLGAPTGANAEDEPLSDASWAWGEVGDTPGGGEDARPHNRNH